MTTSLGRVTARLAEPGEIIPPEFADLINVNIQPPTQVTVDDVYVRAMYIVSDQVNSFGGRFPSDEHERLARLLVDSPVLVGHRKDRLPVGRNFHAVMVERHGRPWVKSYFYWLRSADGAEQLRDNIDGGIYKECSIAFTFHLPECSVCGKDIRRCEHEPFEEYQRGGIQEKCYFNYRQIEQILETSLVYRGAVPDTSVSKDLRGPEGAVSSATCLTGISSPDSLKRNCPYLVIPRYDGLPLAAWVSNDELLMTRLDGTPLPPSREYQPKSFRPDQPVYGMLVGYRGKERCSRPELEDHLARRTSAVTRLFFNVFPLQGIMSLPRVRSKSPLDIRIVPYRITDCEYLERAAQEIMTRDGVEIWPAEPGVFLHGHPGSGYSYRPPEQVRSHRRRCSLILSPDARTARLYIGSVTGHNENGGSCQPGFDIIGFSPEALTAGRRFVARKAADSVARPSGRGIEGDLIHLETCQQGLSLECGGALTGRFMLRPIRLNGDDCYLFYRLSLQPLRGTQQ